MKASTPKVYPKKLEGHEQSLSSTKVGAKRKREDRKKKASASTAKKKAVPKKAKKGKMVVVEMQVPEQLRSEDKSTYEGSNKHNAVPEDDIITHVVAYFLSSDKDQNKTANTLSDEMCRNPVTVEQSKAIWKALVKGGRIIE